ncbi:DNA polymerase IV [Peptoniphilus sp. MSJ-1]|uniref:DNA polymerase IV n=1 Tax=Peptoniphilus ovalis TaxID=2841503 RepID=A0ABS6FFN0_9FIRM|nr:DNA polymerase IV [Peptoniphilus ovalis]MBU5668342.1 DNA polymerase IV [Peptoniphilus ovalis]
MEIIIHVDIDAFYASVEELDDKSIIGKPVVVGGKSNHGVVTTANYVARKYGIHSAMPMYMAKNLCNHLIIKPMRRARYLEKSREVFDVLKRYSNKIEKVSIDESYLAVTGIDYDESFLKVLQNEVREKTGLNVSCGMSYNKFLAKLASDWNKPKGIKIIKESDIPDILLPLDIKKIHGIGRKSEAKLRNIGINTVADLYELPLDFLMGMFKKSGEEIYNRIRGIDKREVTPETIRKSLGTESTFEITSSRKILENYLKDFAEEISEDLIIKEIAGYTLTLKMKDENFKVKTRSKTYELAVFEEDDIYEKAIEIFEDSYEGSKLRLIGLTVSNLTDLNKRQLSFF